MFHFLLAAFRLDGSRTQFFFRPFDHAAIFRLKTVMVVQFLLQKSCNLVGLVILSPERRKVRIQTSVRIQTWMYGMVM